MAEEEIMLMVMEEEEEEEEEMSTTSTTTTLPQEIVMDILSRLPASSLVSNFKLVCKPWRTLINDPDFVKMYNLNRKSPIIGATNNSSLICKSGNDLFQLHPPFNFEGGGVLPPIASAATKLDFDSLSLDSRLDFCLLSLNSRLDFDSLPLKNSRLVGSCNGLLCLSFNDDENLFLLNPSTRRYKLPPRQMIECPPPITRKNAEATFGFGCCCYNSTTNNIDDEYKVVRILFFSGLDNNLMYHSRYQCDIYSMSSNSWRRETRIGGYPYVFSHQQSGVFVNGALHWVARYTLTRVIRSDSWDTIISFNVKDEEFGLVPVPLSCHPTDDDPHFNMHDVILMNMKGCLSMIHNPDVDSNYIDVDLEIWVMKEYGIQESWTKEFVIRSSDSNPPRALSDFTIYWRSNAYVLKGDHILIEGMAYTSFSRGWPPSIKLILYDINEGKIDGDFKRIGVPDEPFDEQVDYIPFVEQVDYIETLVSLKSLLTSNEH